MGTTHFSYEIREKVRRIDFPKHLIGSGGTNRCGADAPENLREAKANSIFTERVKLKRQPAAAPIHPTQLKGDVPGRGLKRTIHPHSSRETRRSPGQTRQYRTDPED